MKLKVGAVTFPYLKVLNLASKQHYATPLLAVNIKISVSVLLFEVLTTAAKHNLTQFVRTEMAYFWKFS